MHIAYVSTRPDKRNTIVLIALVRKYFNPRPYGFVGWCPLPHEVFSRIAKKKRWRVAPPGFRLLYGANLAQFSAKKI